MLKRKYGKRKCRKRNAGRRNRCSKELTKEGEEMGKPRFSIIDQCTWEVPRNEIIMPETEEIRAKNLRMEIPVYCVYIEHPDLGKILFDTGVSHEWQKSWNPTMKSLYKIRYLNALEEKLAELGTSPEQIDLLIISHLHYDHAGNIRLFSNTKAGRKIMISRSEAREAFVRVNLDDSGYSGVYLKSEFCDLPGIGYQLIDGDVHLADGLDLFVQNGHTPGVIGMRIETEESGTYIFCSDACYSALNFEPPTKLPGLVMDPEGYVQNMERIRAMKEKYKARIVYAHDVEDFLKWEKSPYMYK